MKSAHLRSVVVIAFVLTTTAYLSFAARDEIRAAREPLATVPMAIGGWAGHRQPDLTDNVLAVLGVDDYITRAYVKDGWPLDLYVGYHNSQRQGDAIHSPLNCLPGAGWQPLEVSRVMIPVKGAPGRGMETTPVEVNRVVIGKGLERQLVLYWYQSYRRVVASEYWGKVYSVLDAVRYNRTDAALVRVIVPIPQDDSGAKRSEEKATAFVKDLFPTLAPHLPS